MPRKAAPEVAVEDGDQLHRDIHARLPRGHREQEPGLRHHDLVPGWRDDAILAERAKPVGERIQEGIGIEQALDLGFPEQQHVHRHARARTYSPR